MPGRYKIMVRISINRLRETGFKLLEIKALDEYYELGVVLIWTVEAGVFGP